MTQRSPSDHALRRSSAAISARVLDETVILDLDRDRYTRLNGSAGLLWEELAHPRTEPELAQRLVSEYGIDAERARSDVRHLVDRLRDSGLLARSG